jgi:hypothetical protein
MKSVNPEQQIPCIIENGIVCAIRDIYRIIRDLGHVRYQEEIDGQIRAEGEGYIMHVAANTHSATVIANRRIYLNVCGFDYLNIRTEIQGQTHFELRDAVRVLRLTPATEFNPAELLNERNLPLDEYTLFEPEELAEVQLDDDDFIEGD